MGAMLQAAGSFIGGALQGDENRKAYQKADAAFVQQTKYTEDDARDAILRGNRLAGQQRMKGSALVAKQRVAFANSGVDAYSGTPADVAAGSFAFNEFDALTIENNAAREALGHKRTGEQLKVKRERLESDFNQSNTALGVRLFGDAANFATGAFTAGIGG